ncbi:MAG: hypothetical protein ACUVV3_08340 [Dehalococcoidia bacterium]
MARCWVIAPYPSTEQEAFEQVWEYDLRNGVIAIGWRELGDISELTEDQLKARIREVYGDSNLTLYFNILWRFYHVLEPGDVVVARRGRKTIAAVGSVTGRAFYNEEMGRERGGSLTEGCYPNFISVQWQSEGRNKEFPTQVFAMQTMYEIPEEKYRILTECRELPPDEDAEGVKQPSEFVLERYLEDFIVTNFAGIFKGRLQLYEDAEGRKGQQYPTEVGNVDILAREPATNCYVVIELKKGRESDTVVGQTLRYMGWVQENLCDEGQGVKGVIICKEPDPRLSYALRVTPNIDLYFYKVHFELAPAQAGLP